MRRLAAWIWPSPTISRAANRERFVARVAAVVEDGIEEVFDVSVPGVNAFDANGLMAHNCGEQPLPPYGACLLGSINLARLIDKPFTAEARLDTAPPGGARRHGRPLPRRRHRRLQLSPRRRRGQEAKAKRRIGLGVTGLADALILAGVRYGTPRRLALAKSWMAAIERAAYLASAELAREKGAFPLYDARALPGGAAACSACPRRCATAIAQHGIRNGLLTSIAPTGTISLLAGNVSSGIEPVFDFRYERRVLERDGSARTETVEDYAHALYRQMFGAARAPDAGLRHGGGAHPPRASGDAGRAAAPRRQLHLQDHQLPRRHLSFEAFKDVYLEAYDLGLKGCTTYRPNAVTGSVLSRTAEPPAAVALHQPPRLPSRSLPEDAAAAGPRSCPTARARSSTWPSPWSARACSPASPTRSAGPAATTPCTSPSTTSSVDGPAGGGHVPRRRPFEIFINSKNLEHYAWTVALTRMISAIFRRGGDVSFVVEELKAVFDPQGGQWMGGRYVPSLLAAIGGVIERHMIRTGFLTPPRQPGEEEAPPRPRRWPPASRREPAQPQTGRRGACPRCGSQSLHRQEGCLVCGTCGYSKCG